MPNDGWTTSRNHIAKTKWVLVRNRFQGVEERTSVRLLPIAWTLLLSIGCTAESSRPSLPAQPPAPGASVDSTLESPTDSASVSYNPSWVDPIALLDLDTAEKTALLTSEGKASRLSGELHIQLLNQARLTFKDETSPHFLLPRYAGYLKTIHSHVVHGVPIEGSGYYLIVDDSTGDSTVVYSLPVPSPDGKRFVVMSMVDAGAGYDPGLIEVWRMVGRKPEKEFFFATEDQPWQPSDPVWRDSITVDFMKNVFVDFSKPYNRTPGHLVRSGTNWVFRDSVSRPQ